MSGHHCWWTTQSQCDSGRVDLKKMKSCVAYLWLTQSFWSNVQIACLNLKWKHVIIPTATSEIQKNLMCIFFGCFNTKKIVCILVISVMSNIFECQKSWYSHLYFKNWLSRIQRTSICTWFSCLLSPFKFLQMSEIGISQLERYRTNVLLACLTKVRC